jgi:hypothetical protein
VVLAHTTDPAPAGSKIRRTLLAGWGQVHPTGDDILRDVTQWPTRADRVRAELGVSLWVPRSRALPAQGDGAPAPAAEINNHRDQGRSPVELSDN